MKDVLDSAEDIPDEAHDIPDIVEEVPDFMKEVLDEAKELPDFIQEIPDVVEEVRNDVPEFQKPLKTVKNEEIDRNSFKMAFLADRMGQPADEPGHNWPVVTAELTHPYTGHSPEHPKLA